MNKYYKTVIFYLLMAVFYFVSSPILAQTSENKYPENLLYPLYFKNRDIICWDNIKQELKQRTRFVTRKFLRMPFINCQKFQRMMCRAVDRYVADNKLSFTEINDEVLFGPDSPFEAIVSPPPSKQYKLCSFHSIGNIASGCVIYCDVHGMDFECDYYKAHQKELEATRPFLTAGHIAEFIIFSPTLVFVLGLFLYIKRSCR